MITSIAHNDTEAIENILELHAKSKRIDLDPTYSKGNFYKKIQKPRYCFDIEPQIPGVMKADVRKLPLDDNSVETIIFDPGLENLSKSTDTTNSQGVLSTPNRSFNLTDPTRNRARLPLAL